MPSNCTVAGMKLVDGRRLSRRRPGRSRRGGRRRSCTSRAGRRGTRRGQRRSAGPARAPTGQPVLEVPRVPGRHGRVGLVVQRRATQVEELRRRASSICAFVGADQRRVRRRPCPPSPRWSRERAAVDRAARRRRRRSARPPRGAVSGSRPSRRGRARRTRTGRRKSGTRAVPVAVEQPLPPPPQREAQVGVVQTAGAGRAAPAGPRRPPPAAASGRTARPAGRL